MEVLQRACWPLMWRWSWPQRWCPPTLGTANSVKTALVFQRAGRCCC